MLPEPLNMGTWWGYHPLTINDASHCLLMADRAGGRMVAIIPNMVLTSLAIRYAYSSSNLRIYLAKPLLSRKAMLQSPGAFSRG